MPNKAADVLNEIEEEQENPMFKFDVIEATVIKEEPIESEINQPLQLTPEFDHENQQQLEVQRASEVKEQLVQIN